MRKPSPALWRLGPLVGSHVFPVVYLGATPLKLTLNNRIALRNIPIKFGVRSPSLFGDRPFRGASVFPVVYTGAPPLIRISNLRIAPKNIPTKFGDDSPSRL